MTNKKKKSVAICWMNGHVLDAEKATISVYDHGLLYGDGVFEGIRFYNKKVHELDTHVERLFMSAQAILLDIPYNKKGIINAIDEAINAFSMSNGYIRLVVTRGVGSLGLSPEDCKQPNVFLIVDEITLVNEEQRNEGIRTIISSTRRLPPDGLDPRIKGLNYLNHILAKMEANYAGAQEAILLNSEGYVTEGTADNIFVVKSGKLFTPPTSDGALEGVTRASIMKIAAQKGIVVLEKSLTSYDLYTADECFITGTAADLIPIKEIDGRKINSCPGEIYLYLLGKYRESIDQ